MNDVSQLTVAIEQGDGRAADLETGSKSPDSRGRSLARARWEDLTLLGD